MKVLAGNERTGNGGEDLKEPRWISLSQFQCPIMIRRGSGSFRGAPSARKGYIKYPGPGAGVRGFRDIRDVRVARDPCCFLRIPAGGFAAQATLSADSMHELLLGTLPLGRALMFRKLKVGGSKSKAMGLEPLLHACQSVYPDITADALDD